MRTPAACLVALALLAPSGPAAADDFPGARLCARVEARLQSEREALRADPSHAGLVFEVAPADLAAFLQQIVVFGEGAQIALGSAYGPESHGGGVLKLLLDHWRPAGHPAELADRFTFAASRRSLALAEIYAAHAQQIFLPVPGAADPAASGALPLTPELPRMGFRFPAPAGGIEPVETDAFAFLALLVEREPDYQRSWVNQRGQRLSVERLLGSTRAYYLAWRNRDANPDDHSHLHLVELLLGYGRRRPEPLDPSPLKRHFLAVELAGAEPAGDDWGEVLGHRAESLGALLAEPGVTWSADEQQQVLRWLRELETRHADDVATVPPDELPHLLRGLRIIREHRARLGL